MKSVGADIVLAVEQAMKRIKKGAKVPWLPDGMPQTFSVSPVTVTRALSDLVTEKYPVIIMAAPQTRFRHLLADITSNTMEMFVTGIVADFKRESIELLDGLSSDVYGAITLNTTWDGLALRTRVVRQERNTEIEEPQAAFSYVLEIDYIERDREWQRSGYSLDPLPAGTDENPLPGQSKTAQVIAALLNAFQTIPEVAWVEYAKQWPPPMEQIPRVKTPGVWFREQQESYEYLGSRLADKRNTVLVMYVAVCPEGEDFQTFVGRHIARIKDVFGRYADLADRVLTIDLKAVRPGRSEWPVAVLDVEIEIRYVSSFQQP